MVSIGWVAKLCLSILNSSHNLWQIREEINVCGRYALTATPEEVAELVGTDDFVEFPPRFNIAPTQPMLMVVAGPADKLIAPLVRWGLVPSWVKDPKEFSLLVNARAETAHEKPSFRNAMRHRRTLIPASGFYEWFRPSNANRDTKKQAYWIKPKSEKIVCFGGLMETWSSADGSEIDTGCILTTSANEAISPIHHRMPVIIEPHNFDRWLDCKNYGPADVKDLIVPISDDYFEAIAVSDRVNNFRNGDPDIQMPVELNEPSTNSGKKHKSDSGSQFDLF